MALGYWVTGRSRLSGSESGSLRDSESQTARGERETESGRWESVWELGFGRETATGSGGGRDSGFQIQMRDSGLG